MVFSECRCTLASYLVRELVLKSSILFRPYHCHPLCLCSIDHVPVVLHQTFDGHLTDCTDNIHYDEEDFNPEPVSVMSVGIPFECFADVAEGLVGEFIGAVHGCDLTEEVLDLSRLYHDPVEVVDLNQLGQPSHSSRYSQDSL